MVIRERPHTQPRHFGDRLDHLGGEITVNRADPGDVRVVFSVATRHTAGRSSAPVIHYPGIVGLEPRQARAFAKAIIEAADVIEGVTR